MSDLEHDPVLIPDSPPRIGSFADPSDFLKERIRYLKRVDPHYSVAQECRKLRKVSPALISLIGQKKRPISLDRVAEISKLLRLGFEEKLYFRDWIERRRPHKIFSVAAETEAPPPRGRSQVGTHILGDWLNVFVKDSFQISSIQENPEQIFDLLSSIANRPRIEKSLRFLHAEGYLRKTLEGKTVLENSLALAETPVPSQKVRQFHKASLQIASRALEFYGPHERIAQTLVVPLNEESYNELQQMMMQFVEQLKDFAEHRLQSGDRLYQVALHLSPTGGIKK